jgi:hypothetical protein
METLLWLTPFPIALAATVAGAARAEREWPDWPAVLTVLGATVAVMVLLATEKDSEISMKTVIAGSAFGALLIATIPLLIYYGLGRALTRHRIWLALVWVATVVPLGYWLIVAFLLSLDIVHCPPDAYECPV